MISDELRRIGQRLTDPSATEAERAACYAALRDYSDNLKLRDLARRQELVRFSNSLELPAHKIAEACKRRSLADFCIFYGLSRQEVLERTGMAKAGVR